MDSRLPTTEATDLEKASDHQYHDQHDIAGRPVEDAADRSVNTQARSHLIVMPNFKSIACLAVIIGAITGCATVRQQDTDAWVGAPVEALDAHPLFLTMPMYQTQTDSGVETRNYVNSKDVEQCFTRVGARRGDGKYVSHSAFTTCSDNRVVCNNLFYIQGGKVIRYAPTGNCYTDDRVRPQVGYLNPRAP